MRARWAAMRTRSKRFSTFSMQSSTVTRATNVSKMDGDEGPHYTMCRALTSFAADLRRNDAACRRSENMRHPNLS